MGRTQCVPDYLGYFSMAKRRELHGCNAGHIGSRPTSASSNGVRAVSCRSNNFSFLYGTKVLGYNPVGYWKLDETSGSTVIDETATSDGVYGGSPALGQNPLITTGSSVSFSGYPDDVSIPHASVFNNNNVTFCIWFQASTKPSNTHGIVYKAPNTGYNREFFLHLNSNGNVGFGSSDGGTIFNAVNTTNLADGIPHFIACVKEHEATEDILHLYVDGSLVTSNNTGSRMIQNSNDIVLAKVSSTSISARYFVGQLDEFSLFDKILTATEIETIYNMG